MTSQLATIHIIQPGYAIWQDKQNAQKADGTITLVLSTKNLIVDTGLPKDKPVILKGLENQNLSTENIDFVVCTHGDADHVSNNNLFPNAKLIVGLDVFDGDIATFVDNDYIIDENVKIISTPGHDYHSISVVVKTNNGTVVIAGDVFEYQDDWKSPENWIAFSHNPKEQINSRAMIWNIADYIIPGHGDMFKVDKSVDIKAVELKALGTFKPNVYHS